MPAAVPADHDDHHGGTAGRCAVSARRRHGFRAAAAARCHHRRRADRQPDFDAVHHPGRISVLRPAGKTAAGLSPRAGSGGAVVSLSTPFIRRPVATTLLTAGLALSGMVAYKLLPVAPL